MNFSRTDLAGVLLFLGLASPSAVAGPPYFTDDPVPVEYKHWEAYFGSQYLKTADDRFGMAPFFEVNYGGYPNLQLHVVAPAVFDHPQGGPTTYGYGDMEFGAKYRFIQETDHCPQFATFPAIEAPTGDANRNLGNGKAQVFLPLWLQKSWGPWTTDTGGGYWFNPGTGHKNWGYVGWLLTRDLSKVLTVGGEVFHRTPDTEGGKSGTGFTAGAQVNFSEHYHLLFSAGKDFSGPNHLTSFLALQWTS